MAEIMKQYKLMHYVILFNFILFHLCIFIYLFFYLYFYLIFLLFTVQEKNTQSLCNEKKMKHMENLDEMGIQIYFSAARTGRLSEALDLPGIPPSLLPKSP